MALTRLLLQLPPSLKKLTLLLRVRSVRDMNTYEDCTTPDWNAIGNYLSRLRLLTEVKVTLVSSDNFNLCPPHWTEFKRTSLQENLSGFWPFPGAVTCKHFRTNHAGAISYYFRHRPARVLDSIFAKPLVRYYNVSNASNM